MSETPEGYGTQSTPDMGESYPPQTGDLLGSYIARLSARVRELEAASTEQSAYQRSLEDRIERLEALISQPESGSWRNTGSSATFANVKPIPSGDTVCTTCGHDHGAHDEVGPCLVVGCRCSAFKASPAEDGDLPQQQVYRALQRLLDRRHC